VARPRKPAGEKLVTVSTTLPPDVAAAIARVAASRAVHEAAVLRALILRAFRQINIDLRDRSAIL